MEAYMIAVKKTGSTMSELLIFDNETNNTTLVPCGAVVGAIKAGKIDIKNLMVVDNVLKCTQGDFNDYGSPKSNVNNKLTVIEEIYVGDGLAGYKFVDCFGKVFTLRKSDMVGKVRSMGVSNGELIEDSGEPSIKPFGENFKKRVMEPPTARVTQETMPSLNIHRVPSQNPVMPSRPAVEQTKPRQQGYFAKMPEELRKQIGDFNPSIIPLIDSDDRRPVIKRQESTAKMPSMPGAQMSKMSDAKEPVGMPKPMIHKPEIHVPDIGAEIGAGVQMPSLGTGRVAVPQSAVTKAFNVETDKKRMNELVQLLNEARRTYEQEDREIMSNFDYDALYDELLAIENSLGYALPNSPTQNIGYEVMSDLQKERHETKMASLDKTKSVEALKAFAGNRLCRLGWKLDGLTVVLTYDNGNLIKAVTRGNGEVGEVVTHNARVFKNVPQRISFKGKLVLRGEAIITYTTFNQINQRMPADAKYKNPRNLASGSVRQLDSKVAASRSIYLIVFTVVSAEGKELNFVNESLEWVKELGFTPVDGVMVDSTNMEAAVTKFAKDIENYDVPSDGLVLTYNDIAYGASLGSTGKFPRHSLAFKWKDELSETRLVDIEWSCSRTGLINPVAIFEPTEIEGSTVQRASIHNVSIMRSLHLGIGDAIRVYKANMIIPQVYDNLTMSDTCEIPCTCPRCKKPTRISIEPTSGVESLYCDNPLCSAKNIKAFTHFVKRDCMNIDGVSESTLERFIDAGLIETVADIYRLGDHQDEIINMEGFGDLSFFNIVEAINKARKVKLYNLIHALGIPNVGLENAKLISKYCHGKVPNFLQLEYHDLVRVPGIGETIADSVITWLRDRDNAEVLVDLLQNEIEVIPEVEVASGDANMTGMTFVCTGDVYQFSSRDTLKACIERHGGKLSGSVSGKTKFLITNTPNSGTGKNVKADQLGVPKLTEQDFINEFKIDVDAEDHM